MISLTSIARWLAQSRTKRGIAVAAAVAAIALACWATLATSAAPSTPLAQWMPSGAMLYIESPDFASLLHDWNSSPEKQLWLKSDNYDVFSRSRLFGRLADAQSQFAGAAGQNPDMQFLTQIAGKQSAVALYDIGKLEFLYIAHMPNAQAMQTRLMQSRGDFETRKAGDAVFYVRTASGPSQGSDSDGQTRTVAFAVSGDYLLLATREDLLAGALELMQSPSPQGLNKDAWFAEVTQTSQKPGDLRMALDLSRLVPSPYFRSYWVQQNITDLGHYRAAISDLYIMRGQFREDRVLLPESPESATAQQSDLQQLASLAPADAGFYRAESAPTIDRVLNAIDTRLLSRKPAGYATYSNAPPEAEGATEAGSESDLETRIDAPPPAVPPKGAELEPLRALLESQQPDAMLVAEKSVNSAAGVFVGYRSAIVLQSRNPWSATDVERALGRALARNLTAGSLGIEWSQAGGATGAYALDGLTPLSFAIYGPYCIVSDDPAMLRAMLKKAGSAKEAEGQQVLVLSGFNHAAESANFVRATHLVDGTTANATPDSDGDGSGQAPQFFSRNVASLSAAFAAMQREDAASCWKDGALHQTVRYVWRTAASGAAAGDLALPVACGS